jgi:hypothetical protein
MVLGEAYQHADPPHGLDLLRARDYGASRRPAEKRKELPPPHSITSLSPSGSWCLVLELPGSRYRTPSGFMPLREADLFESRRDGNPEHHEFRDGL